MRVSNLRNYFVLAEWDEFCSYLSNAPVYVDTIAGLVSISNEEERTQDSFVVLKHDVETNPEKALEMAKIEARYGLKGSYYTQAYLLKESAHIKTLQAIQALGHEVTYHYDVLDSAGGDIKEAEEAFDINLKLFRNNGFKVETVCQHGNPVIKRVGYHSNRDFFRDQFIQEKYAGLVAVMVNITDYLSEDYTYVSDAGFKWTLVGDPLSNDLPTSTALDIVLRSSDDIKNIIKSGESVIVSVHPHRWQKSKFKATLKYGSFNLIRSLARFLMKNDTVKRWMEKFYFLAKKI